MIMFRVVFGMKVETKRILQFDGPHPGNELYRYHIKMIKAFLKEVGEIE